MWGKTNVFSCFRGIMAEFELEKYINFQIRQYCMPICVAFKLLMEKYNAQNGSSLNAIILSITAVIFHMLNSFGHMIDMPKK